MCSVIRLLVTPWTVAYKAPLFMGFPRQEYCSGLPFPRPGDLPDPGIKSMSPGWQLHADQIKPIAVSAWPWIKNCFDIFKELWKKERKSQGRLRDRNCIWRCTCTCTQSCPTLCDPMDCSLPDSFVHGISQARILQWVASPFSIHCLGLGFSPWSEN